MKGVWAVVVVCFLQHQCFCKNEICSTPPTSVHPTCAALLGTRTGDQVLVAGTDVPTVEYEEILDNLDALFAVVSAPNCKSFLATEICMLLYGTCDQNKFLRPCLSVCNQVQAFCGTSTLLDIEEAAKQHEFIGDMLGSVRSLLECTQHKDVAKLFTPNGHKDCLGWINGAVGCRSTGQLASSLFECDPSPTCPPFPIPEDEQDVKCSALEENTWAGGTATCDKKTKKKQKYDITACIPKLCSSGDIIPCLQFDREKYKKGKARCEATDDDGSSPSSSSWNFDSCQLREQQPDHDDDKETPQQGSCSDGSSLECSSVDGTKFAFDSSMAVCIFSSSSSTWEWDTSQCTPQQCSPLNKQQKEGVPCDTIAELFAEKWNHGTAKCSKKYLWNTNKCETKEPELPSGECEVGLTMNCRNFVGPQEFIGKGKVRCIEDGQGVPKWDTTACTVPQCDIDGQIKICATLPDATWTTGAAICRDRLWDLSDCGPKGSGSGDCSDGDVLPCVEVDSEKFTGNKNALCVGGQWQTTNCKLKEIPCSCDFEGTVKCKTLKDSGFGSGKAECKDKCHLDTSKCVGVKCAANEHVLSHQCVACPKKTTRKEGDDASGADTECQPKQQECQCEEGEKKKCAKIDKKKWGGGTAKCSSDCQWNTKKCKKA
eukprot:TRINITY_DN54418_c0_g1_i1.p1 TRINITY_DN54418_c0_g1~~TRINITY_DN54418_c0_g1_i1.p1  ORF type:complete len:656 (+),score=67.62 TRINITY_DN54418_c0_g1_i1:26-1993(+)